MTPELINYLTLAAFAAISMDLILQIRKVWMRRHSADISLTGECTRLVALLIMQVKFRFVGDPFLIYGQLSTVTLVTIYIVLIMKYRNTPDGVVAHNTV